MGVVMIDKVKAIGIQETAELSPEKPLQKLSTFYEAAARILGVSLAQDFIKVGLSYPQGDRLEKLDKLLPKRENPHTFSETDQDVARALQRSLETIVFHTLNHYRERTGAENLCLAGGVGLNCSMNGAILKRGLFKRMFVQPAGHDGGLSLGAALSVHHQSGQAVRRESLEHVFWGGDYGSGDEIEGVLKGWNALIEYERVDDPAEAGASLIEAGHVIGWIQGCSEFGPRALGNRSILADPRPAKNKDIINAMVKKREAYRPFAPAVLEERASEFFEIPKKTSTTFPYMVFVVDVKEQHRSSLGAITHVDGSTRIQTVSRPENERFWRLIEAFGRRTRIPILLNTSFNNNAEPIVETPLDGLVCFLTTELPYLIIGNWVIRKKPDLHSKLAGLRLSLRPHAKLHRNGVDGSSSRGGLGRDAAVSSSWWGSLLSRFFSPRNSRMSGPSMNGLSQWEVGNTFNQWRIPLDERLYRILLESDGYARVEDLLEAEGLASQVEKQRMMRKLRQLWDRRLISLQP